MDKLFLIDGHALVFKMYYAFLRRPMINSKGADMSILYGFTKYLLEMVEREKPTHLAVAFDPPGGTFRDELYPAYKGTRPPTPQLVIDALEPLTELVEAMNIPVLAMNCSFINRNRIPVSKTPVKMYRYLLRLYPQLKS